jgi:monofunctional biosynthetic peptidoglycan transglycosylase
VRVLRRLIRWVLLWLILLSLAFYAITIAALVIFRWVSPPTTAVQVQRRLEALVRRTPYRKRYVYVPLKRIAPALQHAVIAAEDGRFYQHHGIDWKEVQRVVDADLDDGQFGRGASTISQQLIKNLFLTTHRSFFRKGIEFTLAPVAERILSKARILELYLNVIEWGPGIYGAEAAARNWYGIPAAQLSREQAARLAAIVPAPLRRKPARMDRGSAAILYRMSQIGW